MTYYYEIYASKLTVKSFTYSANNIFCNPKSACKLHFKILSNSSRDILRVLKKINSFKSIF